MLSCSETLVIVPSLLVIVTAREHCRVHVKHDSTHYKQSEVDIRYITGILTRLDPAKTWHVATFADCAGVTLAGLSKSLLCWHNCIRAGGSMS